MSIFLWSAKLSSVIFFFFNAPPTTEIYTLSLHDALPISLEHRGRGRKEEAAGIAAHCVAVFPAAAALAERAEIDRKSTRLNSSHPSISYAVFCLKKKKKKKKKEKIIKNKT